MVSGGECGSGRVERRFERLKIRVLILHSQLFGALTHTTSRSTTPHPKKRAMRWYTVVTLLYDLCWLPLNGRVENRSPFSLAKLMTIMHIAFNLFSWFNGLEDMSSNHVVHLIPLIKSRRNLK